MMSEMDRFPEDQVQSYYIIGESRTNADNAITKMYGSFYMAFEVDEETARLLKVTKESLYLGIEKAVAGNRIGDIGHAVQSYTESFGFSVVREMVGHGIGRDMHEHPEVPNYGKAGTGKKLLKGMTICIEPMINAGGKSIYLHENGWAVSTCDKKNSAHFELTVAVGDGKADILSTFDFIEGKRQY